MAIPLIYPFTKNDGWRRPLVLVKIEHPTTKVFAIYNGMLDTGADECCFPQIVAKTLGYDLKTGEKSENVGLNGQPIPVWKHPFNIYLLSPPKGDVYYSVKNASVSCIEHDNIPPLLGYKNFLLGLNIRFNYFTNRILIELK